MKILQSMFYVFFACNLLMLAPVARAQPVHSPGSYIPLWAGCYGWPGGNPADCYLTITSRTWEIDTNGHTASQHSNPDPSSAFDIGNIWVHSFSTQLYSVNIALNLRAGERENYPNRVDERKKVGQGEYLQACAGGGFCSNYSYIVGWTDIYYVEEKPQWIHIGARPEHMNSNSYNHWMTSKAAVGIYDTAVWFLAMNPAQGKIAVNDMSLPYGGLFDISGQWQPSHWNHQRGNAVDVRSPSGPYAIPDNIANDFVDACVLIGKAGYGQVEVPPQTQYPHIHCEWY